MIKNQKLFIRIVIILSLIIAISSFIIYRNFLVGGIVKATIGYPFKIKIGQMALIDDKMILKFLEVSEDSRCPSDVWCFWEGEARVIVNVIKDNKNLGNFTLIIRGLKPNNLSSKVFDGFSIKLMDLSPYPKTDKKILASDYVATFLITKEKV
ncbi:MAG: hypothetical protein QXQ18_02550 [Candidatus Aenigmatarchaeota archaeon]